jgi:methylated-DNA-[protein]-cysteine S-methyltransferase
MRSASSRWHGLEFGLIADETGLTEVVLPNQWTEERKHRVTEDRDFMRPYLEQFDAYWAGELRQWTLPLHFGGTAFQHAVWAALADIPYGSVVTYQAVAQQIGRPRAVRAVAAAVGKNPLAIVLPCHRVVGADHTLTGYGGGLELKKQLLQLEGVTEMLKPSGHARFAF